MGYARLFPVHRPRGGLGGRHGWGSEGRGGRGPASGGPSSTPTPSSLTNRAAHPPRPRPEGPRAWRQPTATTRTKRDSLPDNAPGPAPAPAAQPQPAPYRGTRPPSAPGSLAGPVGAGIPRTRMALSPSESFSRPSVEET